MPLGGPRVIERDDVASDEWLPEDLGAVAWSYDPVSCSTGSAMVAGTLYLSRLRLRRAAPGTTLLMWVQAVGVTLTAGQCFAGLWRSDGTLVGISADQSAAWQSLGLKNTPLVGGPFPLAAGDYYAGAWSNGVTPPAFFRSTNSGGLPNMGSLTGFLRMGTADVGLTTTPPNPAAIGGMNSSSQSPWVALA